MILYVHNAVGFVSIVRLQALTALNAIQTISYKAMLLPAHVFLDILNNQDIVNVYHY
jgi:hypothetical protein